MLSGELKNSRFPVQSELQRSPARRIALGRIAILIFIAAAGCNSNRKSQPIDPAAELRMSEKTLAIGSGTLTVPGGWAVEKLERYDDKGRPLTVSLVRTDKQRSRTGQRIAYLEFSSVEDRPSWRGNDDVKETSTKKHDCVNYDITSMLDASGDDTPANFTIEAYVKEGDSFWHMHIRFMTPVHPDLLEAVNYIDAIDPEAIPVSQPPKKDEGDGKL
jgi:hypothetical protein